MANKVVLGNFSTMLSRTKAVLAQGKRIQSPFLGATALKVFKDAIADGRRLLPSRYQKRYVDVLEQVVQQAELVLLSLHPRDGSGRRIVFEQLQSVFSIVAAPIVQLRSHEHERELKAFLAEISNIYRRFINDDQVQKGAKFNILSPDLDPLGAFGYDEAGPFTLPASSDLPVALVFKPANEMGFLPLWAADGHEVGGHDIYGAVQGYEQDLTRALEANLRAAFRSGRIKTSVSKVSIPIRGGIFSRRTRSLSMEDFMVRVWKAWLNEANADHAGLLNIGPMYLDSLILLTSALRTGDKLSADSVFDLSLFGGSSGFAPHPIDVVRALLGIEAIKLLSFGDGAAYAKALTDRLTVNQGGALPSTVGWLDQKRSRVITVAVADFQAVLPVVAETLLKTRLPALANQAFGDIINWLDEDEKIVRAQAPKLTAGDTQVGEEVEARHVVAASMLALENASTGQDFVRKSAVVHDTGITILKDMYDHQCLLCSISGSAGSGLGAAPVVNLTRLFKHVRSR